MSNMNLTQAADEVRKMLRGFKAVEIVSEVLERAGSLENAVKESERQLATLRGKCAEEITAIEAARADIAAAKAEAKKVKENASIAANDRTMKADAEIADKMAACTLAIAVANAEFNDAKDGLQKTLAAIVEAAKELEFIEKKISSAKRQVASILN